AIYLGLLLAAVQSLPQDRNGALVFVGLALAREGLLLGALATAAALRLPAQDIVAAVAGFVSVRFVAARWLGRGTPGAATWR
ncbi:MAG: hypothetical protein MUF51_08140, partial [Vicinamibacteria bacterium]|nr:hypothetical protein [Vicinamibacteria bacterium]